MKELVKLIEKEIKWHKEHKVMVPKEFGDGFIKGLKHAIFLIEADQVEIDNAKA